MRQTVIFLFLFVRMRHPVFSTSHVCRDDINYIETEKIISLWTELYSNWKYRFVLISLHKPQVQRHSANSLKSQPQWQTVRLSVPLTSTQINVIYRRRMCQVTPHVWCLPRRFHCVVHHKSMNATFCVELLSSNTPPSADSRCNSLTL